MRIEIFGKKFNVINRVSTKQKQIEDFKLFIWSDILNFIFWNSHKLATSVLDTAASCEQNSHKTLWKVVTGGLLALLRGTLVSRSNLLGNHWSRWSVPVAELLVRLGTSSLPSKYELPSSFPKYLMLSWEQDCSNLCKRFPIAFQNASYLARSFISPKFPKGSFSHRTHN